MLTGASASQVSDAASFSAEEADTGARAAIAPAGSALFGSAPGPVPKAAALRADSRAAPESLKLRKLVTDSPSMRRLLELLAPLARADVSVTLMGETGTGKDVLARTIHQQSARAAGPFVVFDCGSVAANLAESELLGHERGAFTGAVLTHVGAFERAHGGTLFLDEVGELPLELQTRLLRLLGNRSVRRVGGTQDRPFDVRIVAATNRDLKTEVGGGRFRQDLYFRLAAAVVHVPPLRERTEDISGLADRLLEDLGFGHVRISSEARALLENRAWPGNVRELKNALACATAFLDGDELLARHLAPTSLTLAPTAPGQTADGLPLAGLRLDAIERAAIEQTLRQVAGNKARAAQILGIAASTLYEKLKKYGRESAWLGPGPDLRARP